MHNDHPITSAKEDLFNRTNFAKNIADLIRRRTDTKCIVFGVTGPWGDGKSSVLNFIYEELEKDHPNIIQIKFNPWRFNDEASFLDSFFTTIKKDLVDSLQETDQAKEIKKKVRAQDRKELLNSLSEYGEAVSAIPIIGSGVVGTVLGKALKKYSNTELDQKKKLLEDILTKYGARVVVMIDDIDRLAKEEVYAIFRLVKLTADFNNFTYILAYDQEMVAKAISGRFSDNDTQAGYSFLEKVVQIPIRLPELTFADLHKFFSNSLSTILVENNLTIDSTEKLRFEEAFSSSLIRSLDSPRKVVRFSNAIRFVIPLMAGEVNIVDLILFEGLKIFFPLHYALIRDNSNLFINSYSNATEGRKLFDTKFAEVSSGLPQQTINESKTLIQALFPYTQAIWSNYYYSFDPKWVKDRRITTREYLMKFLTFAVSEGQVSDRDFDNVIQTIKVSDEQATLTQLKSLIQPSNAYNVINRLRYFQHDFSIDDSKKISLAISKMGVSFEKGVGFEGSAYPWAQAGILIKKLIWNVKEPNERFFLVKRVLEGAMPIEFAFEILKWLPVRSDSETGENITEDQILQFESYVLSRALAESATSPFFSRFPSEAVEIIRFWSKDGKEELVTYLKAFTNTSIENCIAFLKTIVGKVYSRSLSSAPLTSSPQYEQIGDFTKGQYKFMLQTTGTTWFAESVEKWVSENPSEVVLDTKFSNEQSNENLIQQFLHWHRQSLADQSQIDDHSDDNI